MNRVIKFRIWNKKEKKFSLPYHDIGEYLSLNRNGCIIFPDSEDGIFIFQQFTGLIDQNGKEIFEGDIVRYNGEEETYSGLGIVSIGEFIYDRTVYYYGIRVERLDMNTYFGIGEKDKDFIIVGNIFQNTELLNG